MGDSRNGLVLPHHAFVQLYFHLQQFLALTLHHFGHGNAGGTADNFCNFFGAHLGAKQPRRSACYRIELIGLRFFQQLFEFWQLAVLQLGHFVEIALSSELFNLLAQLVNFFANVLTALRLGLFCLPNFFQIGSFFFQTDNFLFDQAQTFLRRLIGFFFNGFTFNLKLNQAPVQLVNDFGF